MPSYRMELEILALRPGHAPQEVMDAALASLRADHHIDAHDLDVHAGTARILVRFVVRDASDSEEDADARASALEARDEVDAVARVGRMWVLRREGGRWRPV